MSYLSEIKPFRYLVYIAGPITKGDKGEHLREALTAANILVANGVAPIVPHLSIYWNLTDPPGPDTHATWLPIDFAYIQRCDAILRLPGTSEGATHEVEFAAIHGIPTFYYDIPTLLQYLKQKELLEREDYND